jgi:hypothetical protein
MEITILTESVYIPEWNGNRNDSNPIRVNYKTPTMALKTKLFSRPKLKAILTKEGEFSSAETESEVDNKRINEAMITSIDNCIINFNNNKIEIKNAKDLYGDVPPQVSELADECGVFFQSILNRKVETKN